jgi:hypothetical protein
MRGENVVNQAGAYAGNLVVGSDGCADSAAAERHRPVNAPCCDRPRQGNDEVGIIIIRSPLKSTVVFDLVTGRAQ